MATEDTAQSADQPLGYNETRALIHEARSRAKASLEQEGRGPRGRPLSLVITKLDEAEFWLAKSLNP